MPKGSVHLTVELATLPLWAAAGVAAGLSRPTLTAFAVCYVASSLFLSPDLDLAWAGPARRWGRAGLLWRPYARAFRHRGLSHHPLWGPATRLGYLGLLGTIGWLVLLRPLGFAAPREVPWALAPAALAGVYLPSLLHVALDRMWSACRRGVSSRRG